jgi:hypothetical protein
MQELNTQSFDEMVRLADYLWVQGYDSIPQSMRNSGFVKEVPIATNSGDTREFTEADSNQYINKKGEGEQAERGKAVIGYSKIMRVTRFAENFGITFEMRNWGKYPEIVSGLTALGEKPALTMDLDLSHRFTFGTETSYTDRNGTTIDTTCGDAHQLFYTAHELTGSSETFRNRLANNPQLSSGSLRSIEKMAVENSYNNYGEKVACNYSILWVTDDPVQVAIAEELTKSTASVDGANSGVYNVNKGRYQVVVLPRVATDANGAPDSDKAKYWGLVDPRKSTFMLGIWEQPTFEPASSATEDIDTDDWTFKTRVSYGIVIVSPRGFVFSSGDGTA